MTHERRPSSRRAPYRASREEDGAAALLVVDHHAPRGRCHENCAAVCRETPAPYDAQRWKLSERDLDALWHGQRFPASALVTTSGESIAVSFRGRRGGGPGPDYRDAVLVLPGGRVLQGDVELHVRSSDCRAHGHAGDPAYERVVLHVVVEDDLDGPAGFGAGSMRTVAFDRWLAGRADELHAWLQQPPLWVEPCRSAVARRGVSGVEAVLRTAGDRRLEEHAQAFRRQLTGQEPEAVLRLAILDGLGYSQNREPFRRLAPAVFRPGAGVEPLGWEALLFAAAGFLTGVEDAYARELQHAARLRVGAPADVPAVDGWRLWGLRPENHPHRRLAGGAQLFARFEERGGMLIAAAEALVENAAALLDLLTVAATGYWADHAVLGRRGRGAALVGPVRAVELAANAVVPFFAAFGETQGRDDLVEAALAAYAVLPPGGDYGVTRPIARALREKRRTLVRGAAQQQGLLYLFKNYCSRGRCLECPFAEEALPAGNPGKAPNSL